MSRNCDSQRLKSVSVLRRRIRDALPLGARAADGGRADRQGPRRHRPRSWGTDSQSVCQRSGSAAIRPEHGQGTRLLLELGDHWLSRMRGCGRRSWRQPTTPSTPGRCDYGGARQLERSPPTAPTCRNASCHRLGEGGRAGACGGNPPIRALTCEVLNPPTQPLSRHVRRSVTAGCSGASSCGFYSSNSRCSTSVNLTSSRLPARRPPS